MFTNKAFLFFYLLLSLVWAILEICLGATKALIQHWALLSSEIYDLLLFFRLTSQNKEIKSGN